MIDEISGDSHDHARAALEKLHLYAQRIRECGVRYFLDTFSHFYKKMPLTLSDTLSDHQNAS